MKLQKNSRNVRRVRLNPRCESVSDVFTTDVVIPDVVLLEQK